MIVLVALGLRFLAFLVQQNTNLNFYINTKSVIDIHDCIVMNYNGLESSCSTNLSLFPSFILELIVTTMDESTFNIIIVIISISLQVLIISLLHKIFPSHLWNLGLSYNIIYIMQSILDPFTSYTQFLVVLGLYFSKKKKSVLYLIPFLGLTIHDTRYLICLPSLYAMSIDANVKERKSEREKVNKYNYEMSNRYLILLILFWLFAWWITISFTPIMTYNPPLSLTWYLSLQCFADYENYFASLFHLQPLLYALPLWLRFNNKPYLCVTVQLILISMFDQQVSLGNLMFIWLILYADIDRHVDANADIDVVVQVENIKEKGTKTKKKAKAIMIAIPQVTMGITAAISIVCMPVVLEMWLTTAMGNSNFVFFQTIVFWLSNAVLLLEFIRGKVAQEIEEEEQQQQELAQTQKQMKSNKED